jgi:hypothetical protein
MARNAYGARHVEAAYRSGLEEAVAEQLRQAGVTAEYEQEKIPYVTPATPHKYTPDFRLPNGIYIETKGRFETADRKKHLLIKDQHPGLDIRFVFTRSKTTISKASKTTYAMWCEKYGFQYADKWIPDAWLKEKLK